MAHIRPYHLERWDDVQFVLAVARAGSFYGAGKVLAINQSTVSRRIHRMENRLGVKLFDRHSHGMTLSPSGAALVERAQEMEQAAQGIERHLAGEDQRMAGAVRITAPDGMAMNWLTSVLIDLQADYGELEIELLTDAGPVDLLGREADIAIRHYQPTDPRSVVVKVGEINFSIFGSASYLDRYGIPKDFEDLLHHRLVDHTGQHYVTGLDKWRKLVARHPKVVFRVNTSGTYLAAVRAGVGLGPFPDYYKIAVPELVHLPMNLECRAGIWLLSHEETNRCLRVRTTLDFLQRRFRQDRAKWFS